MSKASLAMELSFADKHLINHFNHISLVYDKHADLPKKIGEKLIERLLFLKVNPLIILDVGCGTGHFSYALKRSYPRAQIIGIDFSKGMLQQAERKKGWWKNPDFLQANFNNLPFLDNSVDFIFCNMALQWSVNLKETLMEFQRVLKPEGLLLFTLIGPDSLKEIRQTWGQVDQGAHVHLFLDIHDVGDALSNVGFKEPILDVDYYTLLYPTVEAALKELRAMGGKNLLPTRHNTLTGKERFTQFKEFYKNFSVEEGDIPLTTEIIFGHAWGSAKLKNISINGLTRIPVSQIRRISPTT